MYAKTLLVMALVVVGCAPLRRSAEPVDPADRGAGRTPEEGAPVPLPAAPREFRGLWVASVSNIDWPSQPGLPVEQQQAELLSILDRAVELRLNAVILQVRPGADALYASELEPWSEYLTGEMGKAPEPFYDPLAFAVEAAHERGLELHAWFNPYRARHPSAESPISPDHISQTRPALVKEYGTHLWMDPGEEEVQDHSVRVVLDVVRRYDVDGVHIDDYFYPYRERGADGRLLDFPDGPSWERYRSSGGTLSRGDWRRRNVDRLVERLYEEVKDEKRWVKFGVSPFGLWRPGYPEQVTGFDPYEQIYADSKKWLENGWLDYFTPQLYYRIDQTGQPYPVVLEWWIEQNVHGRHIWPGNFTSRVGGGGQNSWIAREVLEQIRLTREQEGATGNVHFSAKVLVQNREGMADLLRQGAYAAPAVVPASPWLDGKPPRRPELSLRNGADSGRVELLLKPRGREKPWLWVVRTRSGGRWTVEILPGRLRAHTVAGASPDEVAVSAVDRVGNEGPAARLRLNAR